MRKGVAVQLMRKSRQAAAKGLDLLKVLQSEITHELSSPCFQNDQSGPPGDFTLEWDVPHSQDIVLRKKCETGEEVAVSALLGPDYIGDNGEYPRNVMMKVCVKKPGLSSFLQFDCRVFNGSYTGPEFNIYSARYLPSTRSPDSRYHPLFSDLDYDLQAAFKEYLEARGIGQSLMSFLLLHMHTKEQNQYVNWLQKLQQTLSKSEE